MNDRWMVIGGLDGNYRRAGEPDWLVRCPGDDSDRFELRNSATGKVIALSSTDLYAALDEADSLIDDEST